jgi:hypothetical protein
VQSFLNAQLGEQLGGVMGTMMVTAQHVEGFEQLMASFRSRAPARSHRRAPRRGREGLGRSVQQDDLHRKEKPTRALTATAPHLTD